jgi:hypothetical protein
VRETMRVFSNPQSGVCNIPGPSGNSPLPGGRS